MAEPKYVVFKRVEWEDARRSGRLNFLECLLDAQVIREKDTTAGPIFHMYSNLIRSYMDLLEDADALPISRARLEEVADHFHLAGLRADRARSAGESKLPD